MTRTSKNGRAWGGIPFVGCVVALMTACGGAAPANQAPTPATCAAAATAPDEPEFLSNEEAVSYFQQAAEQAHAAAIRHEYSLGLLRVDKRWDEPDQRIWLSIATTETLAALEENRHIERRAHERLQLLAQR